MAGLTVTNVSKKFGDSVVLDNVSFELGDRELLVLLGPSGCGKSTLLRIVAGLENCDSGEIYINNRRVDHLRPRDRKVALVFQNYSLYPHMSVASNLAFPLKVARVRKAEIAERVEETATMLGLADRLNEKPGNLSGGQRQRVALGRAIIRRPEIFLLDEPLSNLDADLRVRMRQEIVRLQRDQARPMIHVTHDQAEALTMADRIALLDKGIVQQIGTPEELYRRPANRFVAEFIGQPRINMISGKIENRRLIPFGFDFTGVARDNLLIGLRPESVYVGASGLYTGMAESCEFLGDQYIATVTFMDHSITIAGLPHAIEPGQPVRFGFNSNELLFFDPATGTRLQL